jgi:hypothetical protein
MSNTKYLLEYMKEKVKQCEFNLKKERELLVEYSQTVERFQKEWDNEQALDTGIPEPSA